MNKNAEKELGLTPHGERSRSVQDTFRVDCAADVDPSIFQEDRVDLKTARPKETEPGKLNGATGQNLIAWNTASGNSLSPLDLQCEKALMLCSFVLASDHNLSRFPAE